jgi:phosphomannomutase
MPASTPMATHAGLRGRPGSELTDEIVERTIGGLLELLHLRELPPTLGLARDERPTGEALASAVARIAIERGADVVDFGVVSTPAAKLGARLRDLGGAVIVTGSHLDPSLNGLKLVAGPGYRPVDVRRLPQPPTSESAAQGNLRKEDAVAGEHVAAICASIDSDAVRAAALSVDLSGGPGRGGAMLLRSLGCEPGSARSDFGLRLDADGDRLQLVDERGAGLDSEFTLPLAVLAHDARAIVKGADTSRMVDRLATEHGGTVRTVPPGEIHLVEGMVEASGDIGGEGNGGVIVPAVGLARDGLAAAAAILWLVARERKLPSVLAAELPQYARRRCLVHCPDATRGQAVIEEVARVSAAESHPEVGVLVERGAAWGLVRLSATEPVFRVTVEAPADTEAEELFLELHATLLSAVSA